MTTYIFLFNPPSGIGRLVKVIATSEEQNASISNMIVDGYVNEYCKLAISFPQSEDVKVYDIDEIPASDFIHEFYEPRAKFTRNQKLSLAYESFKRLGFDEVEYFELFSEEEISKYSVVDLIRLGNKRMNGAIP